MDRVSAAQLGLLRRSAAAISVYIVIREACGYSQSTKPTVQTIMKTYFLILNLMLLASGMAAMQDCKSEDEAVTSDGGMPHDNMETCKMKCYCAIEGRKSMYASSHEPSRTSTNNDFLAAVASASRTAQSVQCTTVDAIRGGDSGVYLVFGA